jgi:hypothetical protein
MQTRDTGNSKQLLVHINSDHDVFDNGSLCSYEYGKAIHHTCGSQTTLAESVKVATMTGRCNNYLSFHTASHGFISQ